MACITSCFILAESRSPLRANSMTCRAMTLRNGFPSAKFHPHDTRGLDACCSTQLRPMRARHGLLLAFLALHWMRLLGQIEGSFPAGLNSKFNRRASYPTGR